MTREEIIAAVLALPAAERRAVLRALEQSLGDPYSSLAEGSAAFWAHRSIDELADGQGIGVVGDLSALTMLDWPEDEAADALIR